MSDKRGGARPKRRLDDKRGGARPGSGPTVRRIHLDSASARALRVLWQARRDVSGNPALTPADVVTDLIRAAKDDAETCVDRTIPDKPDVYADNADIWEMEFDRS